MSSLRVLEEVGITEPAATPSRQHRIADRVHALVNNPRSTSSLGGRMRLRRWATFADRFPDIGEMRVLDVGGSFSHWELAPVRPAQVVVLNIDPQPADRDHLRFVPGDACAPPAWLWQESFDLVYSNSVIEHLGGHAKRVEAAEAIRSLAPRHWVQTPYRYFPIEPHWLFPGFQFLPSNAQAFAASRWPFGWSRPQGRDAVGTVLNLELLDKTEMRYLFPDSQLLEERALGLCKSLIAVRDNGVADGDPGGATPR